MSDWANRTVRIAAAGDLHASASNRLLIRELLAAVDDSADVLLLCGDLTDHGLAKEADLLARELASTVRVPVLAVLGNHDHEAGQALEVKRVLADAGVKVLDGDVREVRGVGFAGTKGFGGGFGRPAPSVGAEAPTKRFIPEALQEARKLERALARLHTRRRVALLHYSPIAETLLGEAPEVYPFLGSGRLEEPLNRHAVDAAFHGHAHYGSPQGHTRAGVPVYNVALPLLRRSLERPPYLKIVALPPAAEPRARAVG